MRARTNIFEILKSKQRNRRHRQVRHHVKQQHHQFQINQRDKKPLHTMFRKRKLPNSNKNSNSNNNATSTAQDLWESNRLQTSGTLQRNQIDTDFSDSNHKSIQLTTHHLTPPFLSWNNPSLSITAGNSNAAGKRAISAVRDPTSDLAMFAKKGSALVAQRRTERERRDKNKVIGKKEEEERGEENEGQEEQEELEQEESGSEEQEKKLTPQEQRKTLPAYSARSQVLQLINDNQVTIIIGETGSGKTTQLTQFLNESGYAENGGLIGCTQPRRVAAISVAKRVADEMGCRCGEEVGYAVRFEDQTSVKTRIKYMTDGVLLRETLQDPDLRKYSVIIMDEAHERSLNTDVLLGLMKLLMARRSDLKLIITSATMNADKFSRFFGDAPQYTIPGRTFPVDAMYSKYGIDDYVDMAVRETLKIHLSNDVNSGDILIFMTGQEDIEVCCDVLRDKIRLLNQDANDESEKVKPLDILPIYSSMPPEEQAKIFKPRKRGHRKVIIATNIAETSLTVDGIRYVIDSGFSKLKVYNSSIGLESLAITPISAANAKQRAGRAGRTGPGTCVKLYTESAELEEMYQQAIPEIQRTNLSNTLLLLKSLGINDLVKFPFLDPPPQESILSSLYELWCIGALDNLGELTNLGSKMAKFPLTPALSKLLLISARNGCSEEMIIIVSMLSVPSVFYRPKERQQESDLARERFQIPESDHLTLLNVYLQWQAHQRDSPEHWCRRQFLHSRSLRKASEIKQQLELIMRSNKVSVVSSGSDWDILRECICSSYFYQAAHSTGLKGAYTNLRNGIKLQLHPTSALYDMAEQPPYVVYHELLLTSREYISCVTAVEPEWLVKYGSVFYAVKGDNGPETKRKLEEQIERDQEKWEELQMKEKLKVKRAKVQMGVVNVGVGAGAGKRRRRGF